MQMLDIRLGQDVLVFDVNDKRRDLSGEGRPGRVTRVGRTLFDVRYDGPWHGKDGIQTFRLEGGHANDAYGHQYVKTLRQAELDRREEIAVKMLLQHGITFSSSGRRELITTEQLEAIAAVLDHERESATPVDLDQVRGGVDMIEGVCRCGATYTVMAGPHEGDDLDKRQADHVREVSRRAAQAATPSVGA